VVGVVFGIKNEEYWPLVSANRCSHWHSRKSNNFTAQEPMRETSTFSTLAKADDAR
jgi:hypothetical protein